MSTNGYLEDDELILYAMHALSEAEAASVIEHLAQSEEVRRRLAEIRLTLGLYAEAIVDPVDAPVGGLDRLMASISQDRNVIQMPHRKIEDEKTKTRMASGPVLVLWAGWALAAALLVAAGMQFWQIRTFRQTSAQQDAQFQKSTAAAAGVARERDALANALHGEARRADASREELSTYKDQSAALSAKVAAEAARAQRESSRAGNLASIATANAQEAAQLKGALAAQGDQLTQFSAQAANARQVLDALSDPAALRVTLTVPKQKKAPSGRGTYVAIQGTLVFTGSNLAPLPANKVYELWLMPSDGASPIPAGTFAPDASGNATVISTHFQRSIAANGFAVTVEAAGGSQKPTLPILLAGS